LLEGDNIPPITRAATRRGEQTPSPVRTTLLLEFEKLGDPTPKMANESSTDQNQDNLK